MILWVDDLGLSCKNKKVENKFIKDLGIKGVSSSTQGDQLRVSGKKRDALQDVIACVTKQRVVGLAAFQPIVACPAM